MFLPINGKEMRERGWDEVDFVYVSGDAYVDHPSFGAAIITRVLENEGFKIGFLAQPNWRTTEDFARFGKPRLGFLVSSGNIDSMVAHYTVAKKLRSDDAYTAGGKHGRRPDRAVTVYCHKIRELYPDTTIVIGGLEASLRRFAHYDYWDDKIKPSILVESKADILSFGMGEHSIVEIANALNENKPIKDIRGICYLVEPKDTPFEGKELPSFENCLNNKKEYANSVRIEQDEQDHIRGKLLKQRHGKWMLIQTPPALPLTTEEFDKIYDLPFEYNYHPSYEKEGGVPALTEVKFSLTHNRGCFGGCNFCSIQFHQGRYIQKRSRESLIKEAKFMTTLPDFKGYIHDVGGPTANFRNPSCKKQETEGLCKGKKCLAPTPCKNLEVDHTEYREILEDLRNLPNVKKVFVRSGIRFDYLNEDKNQNFVKDLVKYHVSGQLRVAPEHCSAPTLDAMGKPHIESFEKFQDTFYKLSKEAGKEQYIVPYLMSSHPSCTLDDAIELALFLQKHKLRPDQVQDFYPTPGTVSTCMYYTGLDPYTMQNVYVPKNPHEKALQRALLQYYEPRNKELVLEALQKAKRFDLINSNRLVTNKAVNYARKTTKKK